MLVLAVWYTEREGPRALALLKRINNILRFGFGAEALEEKRAQKSAARRAIFDSGDAWERQAGFATRRYESYEAYLRHQATKLDLVSERLEETKEEDLQRVQAAVRGLRAAAGRALGALPRRPARHRGRGLPVAGLFRGRHRPESRPENRYVLTGDFHGLVFPDGSVDAIYTNVMDHVFDMGRIMGEVRRVLRADGGLFVVDMLDGYVEGFTPGRYEFDALGEPRGAAGGDRRAGQPRGRRIARSRAASP